MTTPKLPPPPRSPHSSSAFSCSFATTNWPSAVTTSAATRLSQVRPQRRTSQPIPPPRVNPAIPVVDTSPPVTASPNAWVSRSSSRHTTPGCARTRRAAGSTRMPVIGDRSMTSPPSQVPVPATLCPPPRMAVSTCWVRAKSTARSTSATPVHRAISAGRRSIVPFHTRRTSSKPGSGGTTTLPANSARNASTASAESSLSVSVMAFPLLVWHEKDRSRRARATSVAGTDLATEVPARGRVRRRNARARACCGSRAWRKHEPDASRPYGCR